MINKYNIYTICCSANNKYYVGQTMNIKRRWREHKRLLKLCKHPNEHLQNTYNKYGEGSFSYKIVMTEIDSAELAASIEHELRQIYESQNICFNIRGNKDTIYGQSEETKKKIRITSSNPSDEVRRNKSLAATGSNNHNYGKTFSEETRKKMSSAQIGNNKHKGKQHTDATRKIISASRGFKPFFIVNQDGFVVYVSTTHGISRQYGLTQQSLSSLGTGKLKSHRGWKLFSK